MKPCMICGNEKEPEKQNDSYCRECRSIKSRENKHKRLLAKGVTSRPKSASGRSPLCSTCKQQKGAGRENESCCYPCKNARRKTLENECRAKAGLPPIGTPKPRKTTCARCNEPKESFKSSFCKKCDCERNRAAYAKKASDPLFKQEQSEKHKQKLIESTKFKLQKLAHSAVNRAIRKGILIPQPCEVCGEVKAEGHHDDYAKQLEVRWLCRQHHNEHHENERLLTEDK